MTQWDVFARIMEVVGVCAASWAVMRLVVWLDTPRMTKK